MATETTKGATPQEIPSVWTRPQRSRREMPALSRDQIVDEAIALLDAEGYEALSMRKLGARLGAGATSLYTHVSNKDELLELVVDQAFGEVRAPDAAASDEWRDTLLTLSRGIRDTMLRHPWIGVVMSSAGLAYLGPNLMGLSESMLTVIEEAGFDEEAADRAMQAIFAYLIGSTSGEAAMMTTVARSGLSEQEWIDRIQAVAEQVARPYPRIYKRTLAQRDTDAARTREDGFVAELGLIMDGLELRRGR
ncbi:AcrR family transcriptional regulator [Nocardia transvalensis]|uniref:AcrR family transcriptional regulator n=1 Tax=Nocardia transvalensis TaxID=37333 RepID=A0A7W9PC62_9NOCA|nr:TetR/AcrR family transcriptional regulator C-terminal domain-containing protein [Nocardia transvalensis]MBB5913451.1 AcrR family transcriptional regulator [Nocardia transvalensis]